MEILAIRYYRYVKELLQLLDVHKFAFHGECVQQPCVSLSVPNVLPLVAADTDSEFYFAKRIGRRHRSIHFMHVLDTCTSSQVL